MSQNVKTIEEKIKEGPQIVRIIHCPPPPYLRVAKPVSLCSLLLIYTSMVKKVYPKNCNVLSQWLFKLKIVL